MFNLICGVVLASIVALVILGGLLRIAAVASALVPTMSILYVGSIVVALILNMELIPAAFTLILTDALQESLSQRKPYGDDHLWSPARGLQ